MRTPLLQRIGAALTLGVLVLSVVPAPVSAISLSDCSSYLTPDALGGKSCSSAVADTASCLSDPLLAACCPYECIKICTGLNTDIVKNNPLVCGQCTAVLAGVQASPLPGTSAYGAIAAADTAKQCGTSAYQAVQQATCEKGPAGCCKSVLDKGTPGQDGFVRGSIVKEACNPNNSSGDIYYADCWCAAKGDQPGVLGNQDPETYDACVNDCQKLGLQIDTKKGVGGYKPQSGAPSGSTDQTQFVNALCFTPDQCASPDYGGSASAFVSDTSCPQGQGKCLAQEPAVTLSSPVLGVSSIQGFPRYVVLIFQYGLSIVVITAAVMFVYGGFKYIVGSSFGSIKSAKETMVNAAIGLFLAFGAFTILNTLNPALTSYSKLNVYLINKLEFSNVKWCSDYVPSNGGSLQFADAGTPSGSIQYSAAQFTITQDKTQCNKSYYVKNFNGKTCDGQVCDQKGETCLDCAFGGCPTGTTQKAQCVKANIAGNVTYSDGREPQALVLIGVCGNVDNPTDSNAIAGAISDKLDMQLSGGGGGSNGGKAFKFAGGTGDMNKLVQGCQGKGGFRGAVFGVVYKDSGGIASGAVQGASQGSSIASSIGGAVSGAASNIITINDVAIVGKPNCGSGVFSAYADGTASSFDFTDMKTAIYCGARLQPGSKGLVLKGTTTFSNAATFFTQEDLQQAFTGDKPIQCNFSLNNNNAPSDPGTTLMSGCKAGWQPI